MSPDGSGSPSSTVTMPIMSTGPSGEMTTTRSASDVSPKLCGVSIPPLPRVDGGDVRRHRDAVHLARASGRGTRPGGSASSVPGGSTGRCTPFWPPPSMNVSSSEKLPNSVRYTPLFAPIGSGAPTCAITTPISPPGTCTHGNFCTEKIGQSFTRRPGISIVGLVAGLAPERDRVVLRQLPEGEALVHQPDLGGADQVDRLERQDRDQEHHDEHDDDRHHCPTPCSTVPSHLFVPPPTGVR